MIWRPGLALATLLVVLPGSVRAAGTPTPASLLNRPGENVNLVMGTSDYAVGDIRVSFLVVTENGRSRERRTARVWLARRMGQPVIQGTAATLESTTAPGVKGDPHDVSHLYVAHLRVRSPGTYLIVAEPVGGKPVQGLGNLLVRGSTEAPSVGAKAYASNTPTLRSAHGDAKRLTTAEPPDRDLLRYSVDDSLRARRPFVLVFATPKLCQSRTCGPVVEVTQSVDRKLSRQGIRFIHIEIYRDNDPAKGVNRWVKQWRLPSEPYTFLVGRDGRIKATFQGAFSARELERAVRRFLL